MICFLELQETDWLIAPVWRETSDMQNCSLVPRLSPPVSGRETVRTVARDNKARSDVCSLDTSINGPDLPPIPNERTQRHIFREVEAGTVRSVIVLRPHTWSENDSQTQWPRPQTSLKPYYDETLDL